MLTDRSRTPSPERPDNTKKTESSGHQRPHHQDSTYNPPESSQRRDRANKLRISTFDSGFGGFFTAKAIESEARKIHEKYDVDISVSHYGDTKNAPYGEKSPRSIASLTTKGVEHILAQQSDMVFVACNTASTQYEIVKENIERKIPGHGDRVISIIDRTVDHVSHIIRDRMKQEDTIHLAFLATPATIKSGSYPRKLASQLGGTLHVGHLQTFSQERWHKESGVEIECNKKIDTISLPNGKSVKIYQVGPGNWVDLIENGGSNNEKQHAVSRDVKILAELVPEQAKLCAFGEFCTHYPVFDNMIQETSCDMGRSDGRTKFITQGAIMAREFVRRFNKIKENNQMKERSTPLQRSEIQASIAISGENIEQTKNLADTIFPSETKTTVTQFQDH